MVACFRRCYVTVAGLALALEKYGTISLAESLAPAIELAENGFVVTPRFSLEIWGTIPPKPFI